MSELNERTNRAQGFCASCPKWAGECPDCGTFWIVKPNGKRYGVRPVTEQPWGMNLDTLDNVVPGNAETAKTIAEWGPRKREAIHQGYRDRYLNRVKNRVKRVKKGDGQYVVPSAEGSRHRGR